jgi:hypothetical protein
MKIAKCLPGRRQVLAGALAGLGDLAFLELLPPRPAVAASLSTGGGKPGAELEALVGVLEQTDRDQILDAVVRRIRAGASYRDLLAATYLAGVRRIRPRPVGFEFHCVLAVHSAHLAAQNAAGSDRWLPLLWAIDNFKDAQEVKRRKHEGNWGLPVAAAARVPPPSQARQRYVQAMDAWDEEGADLAITALVRSAPAEEIRDLVFRYGARDFRDIGHKAIHAANAWRTLKVIGWQHAEPVLRSVTLACLEHEGKSPANRDAAADRPWRQNAERARSIRADWRHGRTDPAAVRELLQVLRKAAPRESCAAVAAMLDTGIDPASVWDGLFLFAAELVMRHLEIISLHAVTSVNALHHAYQTAGGDETRLLMLLQAGAFVALFRQELGDESRGGARVDTLEAETIKATGTEALAEIFAGIGPDSALATRQALALLDRGHDMPAQLSAAAQRLIFVKGRSAHDYKFSSAALEDFAHLSPHWRNRYLAANLGLLPGAGERDNALVGRARAALARS